MSIEFLDTEALHGGAKCRKRDRLGYIVEYPNLDYHYKLNLLGGTPVIGVLFHVQ